MNKKTKGFSLAELLILLLVISIVLSAAIPVLTKKSSIQDIWNLTKQNKQTNERQSAFFGIGYNQSVIIGSSSIPYMDQPTTTLSDILNIPATGAAFDLSSPRFSNLGDKLVILKNTYNDNIGLSDITNSYISFYNGNEANVFDYVGRLSMDAYNIALGKATLLKLSNLYNTGNVATSFYGNNTAIGQFSLLGNTTGMKNVGLGERTLAFNKIGCNNTAIGSHSLYNLGNGNDDMSNQNTAVGHNAMLQNMKGKHNTIIGSDAMIFNIDGDSNVAIGRYALSGANHAGSRNIAIGDQACNGLSDGNNNICIGSRAGIARFNGVTSTIYNDNYALFIGSSSETNDTIDTEPLIYGHTQFRNGGSDKEIYFNTRKFGIKTFDGSHDVYSIDIKKGNGYDRTGGFTSTHSFNLMQTGSESTSLNFRGDNDFVTITAYNKSAAQAKENTKDISFNQVLLFKFPNNTSDRNVEINTLANSNSQLYTLKLNNKVYIDGQSGAQDPILQLSGTNGFYVSSKDNISNMGVKTTGINITGPNITLKATNGFRLLDGSGNQKIGFTSGGDITLAALSGDQSIKNNFTNIWNEISGLKSIFNRVFALISDERLKNISGENTAGLKEINALKVKNFTFKNDKTNTPQVGVIAQELQKVFPNSVSKGEDGYLRIKRDEIFYAMVNAIKQIGIQIQNIIAKITGIDKKLTELEEQNKILLKQNQEFETKLLQLEKKAY